jgi:hypothetical protein
MAARLAVSLAALLRPLRIGLISRVTLATEDM